MTITASYKSSVMGAGGQFTNTTPQSGICVDLPGMCPQGYFSILFPWAGNLSKNPGIGTKTVPRTSFSNPEDNAYLAFDAGVKPVTVTSQSGISRQVELTVDAIGFYHYPSIGGNERQYGSPRGTNCRAVGTPRYQPTHWYTYDDVYAMFGASGPGPVVCYVMPATAYLTYPQWIAYSHLSFRYRLTLAKPWTWAPGVYRGSYLYRYGAGRDIYFGRNFQGTVDDVSLDFVLTVLPDMYIRFPGDHDGVVSADLAPPGGWFDWQGRMPPTLTAEVPFDFATLGPVRISLQCQNPAGDTCGIVDSTGGAPLAVDALLTDNHLKDDSGRVAIDSRLTTTARAFTPLAGLPVGIVPARLTFRTQPGATRQMQTGHRYGGLVTIVFDSGTD
ncbi:hypothetical protein [Burkholderia plantarii]|uniref:hypothetical protein n=1 Tax=Burkholderia plantarii TaxID=41899 RepID=UPI000870A28A|nr:hypothetical protein [Burkholderia plantarii]